MVIVKMHTGKQYNTDKTTREKRNMKFSSVINIRGAPNEEDNFSQEPWYHCYRFTSKELILNITFCSAFIGMVSYLFYHSVVAFIILMPVSILLLKKKKSELCQKRKVQLEKEFKEVILSVSANLQAGYSVENAFRESYQDIVMLYGENSLMAVELTIIIRKLSNNEQIEDILWNLSDRSGVKDIRDFADIFKVAKRSGGDIRGVIANTASVISDKQDVRREIETVMSDKKMEQTIMQYMPFAIMLYMSLTSPGFFDILYHNLIGVLAMTGCLILYIVACFMADKILKIEI